MSHRFARISRRLAAVSGAALTLAAIGAPAAGAATTANPVGVATVVTETQAGVTMSFAFSGTEATAFLLAVPNGASLSTLDDAKLARLFSLSTFTGQQVHYRIEQAGPRDLLVKLHSAQPNLRLSMNLGLFRFTAAETKVIASGRVTKLKMGAAFVGAPGQLIPAKFTIDV